MRLGHVSAAATAAAMIALVSQAHAGANLVVNGDFSAGAAGFTSDYIYVGQPASPWTAPGVPPDVTINNPFTYGVGANASLFSSLWADIPAPHGSGNYMIVNGAAKRPTSMTSYTVWEQTVTLAPGMNYDFSAEVASLSPGNPASLHVYANGIQIGAATTGAVGDWHALDATITVGSPSNVILSVQDSAVSAKGNDFGLADIALSAAIPEPSTWGMLGLGIAALAFAGRSSRRSTISIV
ncbi:putative secreted protein with PEP-CTERM sorting signal [Roseiarcus fermentans]|uniref:Putative secreted protein with PEP-CTERM sorting signal n=1 Tax=Roseiarcus fermentans TaxID=1473586 RepID=A0A366EV63_9HYPH|nr:PEP-CTERM sorting domain-containing protein [Roseiarcus fermentans]RBP06291.1 putative secreted protein with PEP-CTERM sorting signal [Roseiarcus fermentans]